MTFGQILNALMGIFRWWILIMPWESGLRVRCGRRVKVLTPGIHLRIPFFDQVYRQTTRMRVSPLPMQTLATSDGHTVTIMAVVGYTISDIRKLYQTLHQPELTVANMAMGALAEFVRSHRLEECKAAVAEAAILEKMKLSDYGLGSGYARIVGYAIVKTFRLIQDQTWVPNGHTLEEAAMR